jgi:hypothetical protein
MSMRIPILANTLALFDATSDEKRKENFELLQNCEKPSKVVL